jgi:hypothetical protein
MFWRSHSELSVFLEQCVIVNDATLFRANNFVRHSLIASGWRATGEACRNPHR